MRTFKIALNAFALLIGLPVVIVAVLGMVFTPLEAAAHPVDAEKIQFVEVNDR